MSQPDLFVVCKNCGSEVSPYVTECPYCGQRVRKRAPKLDRGGGERRRRRRRRQRLPRLRPEEITGIAPDTRPYATLALIALSLAATVVYAADPGLDLGYVTLVGDLEGAPADDGVLRWFATPFLHADLLGYQFVALVAVGVFGLMLERRFGPAAVIAVFALCGAAGCALAVLVEAPPLLSDATVYGVVGANGAALGMLCAWLVDDRRAARRGDERENDLLGVYVVAVVLVLLSLAVAEANIAAAVGGALAGALLGLLLPLVARRGATY
ncbi:MAG: rhomboid family intramembrane serine protease [Thermoleophilaceae bacterium]